MKKEFITLNKQIKTTKTHKKVCTTLSYIEDLLILASTVTACVSNFAVASLVGIPIGIASFAVGQKICAITAGIKNDKAIIDKRKKKNVETNSTVSNN